MTTCGQHHVGDSGTVFAVTITACDAAGVAQPVPDIDSVVFVFDRPALQYEDGERVIFTRPGTVVDAGTASVEYAFVPGDLVAAGVWKVQAFVRTTTGGAFHSDVESFVVEHNLLPYASAFPAVLDLALELPAVTP